MAGGIVSAIAATSSAQATQRGDIFQAGQEQTQFYQGMTKSFQTDTAMTQHLTSTIANIEAVRASSGASILSPSGEAIQNRVAAMGGQDISRETTNIQQQAQAHLTAMNYYQQAGSDAIKAGNLSAVGDIIGGISSFASPFIGGLKFG